jgi:hypothetical protein
MQVDRERPWTFDYFICIRMATDHGWYVLKPYAYCIHLILGQVMMDKPYAYSIEWENIGQVMMDNDDKFIFH